MLIELSTAANPPLPPPISVRYTAFPIRDSRPFLSSISIHKSSLLPFVCYSFLSGIFSSRVNDVANLVANGVANLVVDHIHASTNLATEILHCFSNQPAGIWSKQTNKRGWPIRRSSHRFGEICVSERARLWEQGFGSEAVEARLWEAGLVSVTVRCSPKL